MQPNVLVICNLLHIDVAVYTVNRQHLKWKVTTEKRRKTDMAMKKDLEKGVRSVLTMDRIRESSEPGETRKEVA